MTLQLGLLTDKNVFPNDINYNHIVVSLGDFLEYEDNKFTNKYILVYNESSVNWGVIKYVIFLDDNDELIVKSKLNKKYNVGEQTVLMFRPGDIIIKANRKIFKRIF